MQLYNTGEYFLNREKWYMNVWKSSIKNYLWSFNSILIQLEVRKLNNHEISWSRPFLTSKIVNWYFELSRPQRIITSRLKTMFNLSPIYSARKSPNHKLLKNHKISPVHNIKQNIHKHRTQFSWKITPFGTTPVKKAHKARTRWYRGPFRRFINTRFFLKV